MSSEPRAVKRIKQEHRLLEAALQLLCQASEDASLLDAHSNFQLLRERLFQLEDTLGREHHVIEDEILFPLIAERCPALQPVLARLQTEHDQGVLSVQLLMDKLEDWESMGGRHVKAFNATLQTYAEAYRGHMQVEENYVLPVAMDYLSDSDWLILDLALSDEADTAVLH